MRLRSLVVMGAFAIGSCQITAQARASASGSLTLRVRTHNLAKVPNLILERALGDTTLILGAAGIDTVWDPRELDSSETPGIPEQLPNSPPVPATVNTKAGPPMCGVTRGDVAEGNSLALAGHLAEGQAKLEYALNALEQGAMPDSLHRACLMNALGFLERQQGRPAFAIEWFRRGLELKPQSDALLVLLTGNLAGAYAEFNHLDQAEEAARKALQIAVRAFGPDHPETLFPVTTLAFIHVARGNYDAAEPVLRRVLAQAERSWGLSSYEVAGAAGNLGLILLTNRRYALARELLLKSLAGLEQNPIRAKDQVPLTQALVAGSYAAEGRRRPAEIWLERALRNAQQELSPEDPSLSVIFERAATARFCLNDTDAGAELFDRSVALLEAQHGSRSQPVLDALERYAALLRLANDKRRVKVLEARREGLARKDRAMGRRTK